VRRSIRHNLTFRALCIGLLCVLASGLVIAVHAGLRGPGKYCGVIVFDRWDTCFLLSGHYITYISESVKDQLRPYTGKAMQLDVTEISQPRNPSDLLVQKYRIIGPAPDNQQRLMLDSLELISKPDFAQQGGANFLIEVHNAGKQAVKVNSYEFGPTILAVSPRGTLSASDGRSGAWITRVDILNSSRWETQNDGVTYSASYSIDPKTLPPVHFQLAPGEFVTVRVNFELPPGQYQFVVGYGGGGVFQEEKSLASNAISFDVNDRGIATLAEPEISSPR
jgi:hypothetical protein